MSRSKRRRAPIDDQVRDSRRLRHAFHSLDEDELARAERGADLVSKSEARAAEEAARAVREGRLLSDRQRDLLERLGDRADMREHDEQKRQDRR